jgi:uncharacterized phage-associated protein
MAQWKQDTNKLRELILFVAQRCANDDVGDIFLNKVLFFSDAYALQHLGHPITGARYQKQPLGPTSLPLLPLRTEMVERGDVEVTTVEKRTVTRALRDPDMSRFSEDEIKLVERVIDLFRSYSAMGVSKASHDLSPGWNLVEVGEEIPLESQLISTEPVPAEAVERGSELAARFGW